MEEKNDFPNIGVNVSCFRYFIDQCGGRNILRDKSTAEVCDQWVKPFTGKEGVSYCEYIKNSSETRLVGRPTIFISHAWSYLFLDVVEAIFSIADQDAFVWFDLFSHNQNIASSFSFSWYCGVFRSAIAEINHTVLILAPWTNPVSLTRAWCLWEIYCTIETKSRLAVVMCNREHDNFQHSLVHDFGSIKSMLAMVDSRNSTAFKLADQQRIHAAIEDTIGFDDVNRIIFDEIRRALVGSARLGLRDISPRTDYYYAYLSSIAQLLRSHGNLIEAEPLFAEALEGRRALLGDAHADTLQSVHCMAGLCKSKGRLADAELYFREAWMGRRGLFSGTHACTLQSGSELASVLAMTGQLSNAEELFEEVLFVRRQVLSADHPDTLLSMNNLARCKALLGKAEESEPLYREALVGMRGSLGDSHPDTLLAMNNLAGLLKHKGEYEESELLFREALHCRRSILKLTHPDTSQTMNDLGELLALKGNFVEAEKLLRDAILFRQHKLGYKHPFTLDSVAILARLLVIAGRGSEAGALRKYQTK